MALSIDLHDHEIIVIKMPFEKTIKMWDINAVPKIIETGKEAVEKKKDEILDAFASYVSKQLRNRVVRSQQSTEV